MSAIFEFCLPYIYSLWWSCCVLIPALKINRSVCAFSRLHKYALIYNICVSLSDTSLWRSLGSSSKHLYRWPNFILLVSSDVNHWVCRIEVGDVFCKGLSRVIIIYTLFGDVTAWTAVLLVSGLLNLWLWHLGSSFTLSAVVILHDFCVLQSSLSRAFNGFGKSAFMVWVYFISSSGICGGTNLSKIYLCGFAISWNSHSLSIDLWRLSPRVVKWSDDYVEQRSFDSELMEMLGWWGAVNRKPGATQPSTQ